MTREEAIAIIENEKKCVNRANKNDFCNRDCYNCELVKTDIEILTALEMAIKALEYDDAKYHAEHGEVIVDKAVWEDAERALEQEPCEDAISRDAVLEKAVYTETEEGWSGYTVDVDYIKSLPPVKPQEPKWISVSERLPEEETDVLICNENGDIELSRGSYSTEVENDFIWYTSGWRFGKVIAWMPLPQPYKAETRIRNERTN